MKASLILNCRTVLTVLLVVCGAALAACGGGHDLFPEGLSSEAVQMHIHGHSHHNGDRRPGSMQWHSHFAAQNDLDVLWWSDHSEMFDLRTPLRIDQNPVVEKPGRQAVRQAVLHADGTSRRLALVAAPPGDARWIRSQEHGPNGGLRLVARSGSEARTYDDVVWTVRGAGGSPRGFLLPRPVSSGAVLTIDLEPLNLGPETRLDVLVGLSWHHRGGPLQHSLRYRLVPGGEASDPQIKSQGRALLTVPIARGRSLVELDLERDAGLLRDGADNTITSLQMRLAARSGAAAAVEIFGLELASRAPEPEHQLARLRGFAAAYATEYEHTQHVGVEFLSGAGGGVHLNAFLPDRAVTGELVAGDTETWDSPREFVRRVHEGGGSASLNHIFGPGTRLLKPRRQQQRSSEVANDLLANRAYGADILEVGYLGRGGVGLDYHLRTWDLLTARGLYLYGNGVSDAHGGAWGPDMLPNPFVTWIWTRSREPEALIEGIQRGRMVFGDPFSYSGRLYFRVGDAEMGDRLRVQAASQELRVAADGDFDPGRHQLFLVQGRIRPGRNRIEYLSGTEETHKQAVGPGEAVALDVSRPCFVRLELWSTDGKPLRFTNPIVFDPANGSGDDR